MNPYLDESLPLAGEEKSVAALREPLAKTPRNEMPWCILVIGALGTGKSTIAERLARALRFALVDSDIAKDMIPDYVADGAAALAVHLESEFLASDVAARLRGERQSYVRAIAGTDAKAMAGMAAGLHVDGYQIFLLHLTLDFDEAYRRMVRRLLASGRVMASVEQARAVADLPARTFDALGRAGLLDGWADLDVSGAPRSEKVREVAGAAPAELVEELHLV